ncbi:hypothetical protein TSUD_56100 [Trifolium subterraneum]|uniref:F-box domain-containing protein n=1 Tax=Trifolium subterraneum TaxID=3900 RepID=A0A2Z6MM50_TRISU|nr:hypothetical protein TSUD_56100 [Trifolium subterraneum]
MKKIVPYLPNELITQILLRLPVKSLIRFKCVRKSWFSLISSDTHFANSQFQLTSATRTHRALFISIVSPHKIRSVDLEASLDDDSAFASHKYPTSLINISHPFSRIEIKGSCRGFILLLRRSTFYIWNPSTGVHKKIPLSPLSFNLDEVFEYFYGFGYDLSTDDYLIVSISYGTNSSYFEFFSLRANKWEQIDDATHIHYLNNMEGYDCEAGSLFNGAIHWFACRPDLENNVIVAFDLMKKKLLDMNLPYQFDHELSNCGLWVFREYLSLWAMNYDNDTVEIWVMKEYKVHSSWTKTHVLLTHAIPTKYFFPLCSTKSGDIVGTNGIIGFVKYNDEGQLLGHHSYFNQPYRSYVVMYTDSLLSLPGDNVQV